MRATLRQQSRGREELQTHNITIRDQSLASPSHLSFQVLTTEGLVVILRPTEAGKGEGQREEYGKEGDLCDWWLCRVILVSSVVSKGGGAVSLRCRQYSTLALLLIFGSLSLGVWLIHSFDNSITRAG